MFFKVQFSLGGYDGHRNREGGVKMTPTYNFKRIEKKYLLSETQFDALISRIGSGLAPDAYGRSTVMSLYLDTPDHRLIRDSIEATDYRRRNGICCGARSPLKARSWRKSIGPCGCTGDRSPRS